MWCDVFDEISHILSHSVFLSWISSPSYLTSMFLLLQTSIWQVNRSLIDRRQWSDLQETCTGVCMLLCSQSQCSSFSTLLANLSVPSLFTVHLLIWTTTSKEITMTGKQFILYTCKNNLPAAQHIFGQLGGCKAACRASKLNTLMLSFSECTPTSPGCLLLLPLCPARSSPPNVPGWAWAAEGADEPRPASPPPPPRAARELHVQVGSSQSHPCRLYWWLPKVISVVAYPILPLQWRQMIYRP